MLFFFRGVSKIVAGSGVVSMDACVFSKFVTLSTGPGTGFCTTFCITLGDGTAVTCGIGTLGDNTFSSTLCLNMLAKVFKATLGPFGSSENGAPGGSLHLCGTNLTECAILSDRVFVIYTL